MTDPRVLPPESPDMHLTKIRSLVLVGAGKMGGAMLSGWLRNGLAGDRVAVIDPMLSPAMRDLCDAHGVRHLEAGDLPPHPDVMVLAVKPQQMGAALPALAGVVGPSTVVVSVAAGTTLASLADGLGAGPIVRVMPNTPAQVGKAMSVAVANPKVTQGQKAMVTALMDAIGHTAWIENEAEMDAVTALSGSGPAYVFLMVEAMAEAGRTLGLPAETAARLARQTIVGAGALLEAADEDPATLRRNVTSPGGTTAAALAVLMADDGLQPLISKALAAAARRSRELAG